MIEDNEKIYDEQISPLMTKIIAICKKHHIPMAAVFQYVGENGEEGEGHCSTYIKEGGMSERMEKAVQAVKPSPPPFCMTTITTEKS